MGVIGKNFSNLLGYFDSNLALKVLLLSIVLAVVALFIWKFYRSTSKRNLIELNLRQYNWSDHPLMNKMSEIFLYLVEYIIIMPFLIALWFGALSFILLLIAENNIAIEQILLVAVTVIGAVRILAYFKEEVAADLAKLFPFIALSVFLLNWGNVFNFDNILTQLKEILLLLSHVLSYVIVVFLIEIVLRVFYIIYEFWQSEEDIRD